MVVPHVHFTISFTLCFLAGAAIMEDLFSLIQQRYFLTMSLRSKLECNHFGSPLASDQNGDNELIRSLEFVVLLS